MDTMSADAPLLSLCMATCLRPDLFPESLEGLLRQTYKPLEIIILADGSVESTLAILRNCKDERLRWICTRRPSGMVPAWNRVCREARGKYLLFCADDDVLTDHAVDRQVELLQSNPNVGFCHADWAFIDDDGKELGRWVSHEGTWVKKGIDEWPRYLIATRACMQTVVVRKDLWDEVGGWDEDAGNPGDNSLYLKLLRISDVGHVDHVACRYRYRTRIPDSWEKRFRDIREYYAQVCKYLAEPPAGLGGAIDRLRSKAMASLSRRSVQLLCSAPDEHSALQAREWVRQHVWPDNIFGALSRAADRSGGLNFLASCVELDRKLRELSRPVVKRLLRR